MTRRKGRCFSLLFHPSSSTGKEKDSETGYYAFGARYYDCDLSGIFLSVDPMADKYPNISPYAYCAWNPVKLVDPDGREIFLGINGSASTSVYDPQKSYKKGSVGDMLNKIYKTKAGKFVIDDLKKSKNNYFITTTSEPSGESNPCYSKHDRHIYLNKSKFGLNIGTLSHELFHAFQHENKRYGKSRSCEVEAFIFAGIVLMQMDGALTNENMSSGMKNAYSGNNTTKSEFYIDAMSSLTNKFDAQQMTKAVSLFKKHSRIGSSYSEERGYKYTISGDTYSGRKSLLNRYSKNIY